MNKKIQKPPDRLSEFNEFYEMLLKYYSILGKRGKGNTTKTEDTQASKLLVNIQRKVEPIGKLITELTGLKTVDLHGTDYDMWTLSLKIPPDRIAYNALGYCIQATNRATGQLTDDIRTGKRDKQGEIIERRQKLSSEPPKAFIAHGGESPALRKLESYLEALGIQPLVVEEQPSGGRSIAENVDYYARQSDFAIILATKGDVDGKTGGFIPRGNVLMEIGKLQELLKDRIVYLVQAGTNLPTNISEKVRVRFSPQSMDDSFIKIAKELKKFGILKAVKPQKE